MILGLFKLIVLRDYTASLYYTLGWQEDSKPVLFLLSLHEIIILAILTAGTLFIIWKAFRLLERRLWAE